jgi:Carboxypeptidase regulatory-like domain
MRKVMLAIMMTALLAVSVFAQGTRGTIGGTITDPNGAAIPGAVVTLRDNNRGTENKTVSNESGDFQFLEVEPATYSITISANGFAPSSIKEVRVEPNRNVRLEPKLTIGTTNVEITVSAGQELVDRESPTLGTTIDPKRIIDLPLNGRNVLALAGLQTGVTDTGGIRVNGGRTVENNFTLDGGNNNEIAVGGQIGAQPSPDAVQEFRILTSVPEAEFGRNSGSIINVVTRSGGNDYHGNARLFYRPTFLSAARYFDQNDPTDKPRPGTTDDFRRKFERKQFGGNFGGPIVLPWFGQGTPKLWSGKNKSFFFVDYEGTRQLIGDTRTISNLPTADERAGIFTRTVGAELIDPATGNPFPIISTSGTTVRQQIPGSRISPIATYYRQFLPVPNAAGQASVGADSTFNADVLTIRVDPYVTDRQVFSGTFNRRKSSALTPFAFGGASIPGFGGLDNRTTYNYGFRHTYTFGPSVVNAFLASYSRNNQPSVSPSNTTTPAQIGFTANFVAAPRFAGPPSIRLFDRGLTLGNSIQGPQSRITENFQIQDALSWSTGSHRFKFGFDGTKYRQNTDFLFINQGSIGFSGVFGGNSSGDDFADLLIGVPNFIQFGSNGQRDFRQEGGALFVQDNWKVSNSFSLSLGVRYEYVGPLTDKYNRVAFYRPTAAARGLSSTILSGGQLKTFEGVTIPVGAGLRAPLGLLYPGDADPDLGGTVPNGGVKKDLNNFAPRFGFAYSPDVTGFLSNIFGKNQQSVIRGGFGVFYGAIVGDTALQQLTAPGFQGTNAFFGELGGTLANPFAPDPYPVYGGLQPTIPNPFLTASAPTVGVSPFTRTTAANTKLTQLSRAIDPKIKTPYTYQYNLTFERAFFDDYVLRVGYAGTRGRKLYAIEQVNPAYGTLLTYPTGILAAQQFVPTVAAGNINARRVNTDFGLGIAQQVAAGNSWYNSAQIDLSKRFSKGLLFQVAYTYSKSITDTAGTDTNRGQLDLLNRRFGKGLSSDDVPHRLAVSTVWEIPFAKKLDNAFLRRVLDGWQLGGIYIFESGRVFSVGNATDTIGAGGGILSFADLNDTFALVNPKGNQERAFNAGAFKNVICATLATCARRGTSGPNNFRLDNGINEFNLSLIKKTRLWNEKTNIEIRFEAFNALNRTQFTTVNLTLPTGAAPPTATSGFGKYTDARESRVIQLGARFSF